MQGVLLMLSVMAIAPASPANVGCHSDCKTTWGPESENIFDPESCTLLDQGQMSLELCKTKCDEDDTCKAINYKAVTSTPSNCILVLCLGPIPDPTGQELGYLGYKHLYRDGKATWRLEHKKIWVLKECEQLELGQMLLDLCKTKCDENDNCKAINHKPVTSTPSNCVLVLCSGTIPEPTGQEIGYLGYKLLNRGYNISSLVHTEVDAVGSTNIFENDGPDQWGTAQPNIWHKTQCAGGLRSAGTLSLADCKAKCVDVITCNGINYKGANLFPTDCELVLCKGPIPIPIQTRLGWHGYKLQSRGGSPSWTPATKGCIKGHNKLVLERITSLAACKLRCQSQIDFVCKSIEHKSHTCVLSESTSVSLDYLETCDSDGWAFTELVRAGPSQN